MVLFKRENVFDGTLNSWSRWHIHVRLYWKLIFTDFEVYGSAKRKPIEISA